MDEAPTGLGGWIGNIISVGGAITGIVGIFAILNDDFHFVCTLMWCIFIVIVLLMVLGTDGDEQVEHAREVLDVPVSEGLPHGEGITGDYETR